MVISVCGCVPASEYKTIVGVPVSVCELNVCVSCGRLWTGCGLYFWKENNTNVDRDGRLILLFLPIYLRGNTFSKCMVCFHPSWHVSRWMGFSINSIL